MLHTRPFTVIISQKSSGGSSSNMTELPPVVRILSQVSFEKSVFPGTPPERRQIYFGVLERLEGAISRENDLLNKFWSHLEDDVLAWDAEHPFSLIEEEFPRVSQSVTTYRGMPQRAKSSLNTITRHWKEAGEEHFSNGKYDLLKYVAKCAPLRSFEWCMTNIRVIIEERLQNPGPRISNKNEERSRDWQRLYAYIEKNPFTDTRNEHRYISATERSQAVLPAGETGSTAQGELPKVRRIVEEVDEAEKGENNAMNDVEEGVSRTFPDHQPFSIKQEFDQNNQGGVGANDQDGGTEEINEENTDNQNGGEMENASEGIENNQESGGMKIEGDNEGDRDDRLRHTSQNGNSRGRVPRQVTSSTSKRPRRTIDCTCPDFPEGPSEAWKKEVRTSHKHIYNVEQGITLMKGIAWGDFNACHAHLI